MDNLYFPRYFLHIQNANFDFQWASYGGNNALLPQISGFSIFFAPLTGKSSIWIFSGFLNQEININLYNQNPAVSQNKLKNRGLKKI